MLRRPLEPGQYTSLAFGRRCRQAGIAHSMGFIGDSYDNALAESFFASLECELIDRSRWRSFTEARMAVFDYLEAFYNPRRRQPRWAISARPNTNGGPVLAQPSCHPSTGTG
jgi:transposase InsO family protein